MYADLIAALGRGCSVITPNRRLAAAIRHAYDRAQREQGAHAWRAADVVPWIGWLARAHREAFFDGATTRLLMSGVQERFLWRRLVESSTEGLGLLEPETTADAALQAWISVHAWHLLPALRNFPLTEEGQAFQRWAAAYQNVCTARSFIDQARLPDLVQDLVRAGKLNFPFPLLLFGFDRLTPQQQALVDGIRHAGGQISVQPASRREMAAQVVAQPGIEQEIRAAAMWARSRLMASRHARVGVVVPDLARLREIIVRVFDDVLIPDAVMQGTQTLRRPWNISLGTALSDWPLIHSALLILDIACGELDIERASQLLRSPFLGSARSEQNARALLDARLRRFGQPHIGLDTLRIRAGTEGHGETCGLLAERLDVLRARQRSLPGEPQPISFWGPVLQSLLSALQWPGERELNSEEYQTLVAWKDMVSGLAQLDPISDPVSLRQAVDILSTLARERVFQPETPDVPIQILGTLESAELRFDHLWVVGLTDEAWPRLPHPNALLPVELQRARDLPGSSAGWELAFARGMQAGWCAYASEVVFSYHSADGDRAVAPSPLLAELPRVTLDELQVPELPDWRFEAWRTSKLDRMPDWQAIALGENIAFPGGARVLQDQAACPFRAFAAHRLGARTLDYPEVGLSARDRGVLLHAALAEFWTTVRTQAQLLALERTDLAQIVQRCVLNAIERLRPRRTSAFQRRFIELELERLCSLFDEWLQIERERMPFEVTACEQDWPVRVAGLELRLRIDRIDRLERGDMLIDYKTGPATLPMWFGARPDEPQLPLYAVTQPQAPQAVAFARVARGDSAFCGLADRSDIAPGVSAVGTVKRLDAPRDWVESLDSWRAAIEGLANAFRAGVAAVDPKKGSQTCRYCDLATLCRVNELVDRGSPTAAAERNE